MRPRRWLSAWAAAISLGLFGARSAHATVFQIALGFEDDVDLVTAPDGQFLVIPEEKEAGEDARVTIEDLDPTTGEPIARRFSVKVLGFEDGVDPYVLPVTPFGGYPVIIPTESEDGSKAEVVVLVVDAAGNKLAEYRYPLGNLGFREDVDGTPGVYHTRATILPLESEDHSVRGILIIDVDPSDGDFGDCTLLSTDGRAGCGGTVAIDWLPGLAEGADPVAYEMIDRLRLALPVQSAAGADLLLVDFDPSFNPPLFMPDVTGDAISVKALNAGGAHPTDFPGFERDVDMALFETGTCGVAGRRLLVPVEGRVDVGDLYLLDENGNAQWVLSEQASTLGLSIPGYEIGVDVVPWCGIPAVANPNRLVVPLENASGMDADLWIVDLPTGAILARAEDPARNPGLVVPGYEMGVDPLQWTPGNFVLPVERLDGLGGLLVIDHDATMVSAVQYPTSGFQKSVDPIVDATTAPPTLFVPISTPDGSDQDVLIYRAPPGLAVQSLEASNAGVNLSGFERDVDLGLITRPAAAAQWVYLPEEDESGALARVRFEPVPQSGRYLLVATPRTPALGPMLYFVGVGTGHVDFQFNDLLGLEMGLDMASQFGPVTPNNPPQFPPPGTDYDSDPTLGWAATATDVEHIPGDGTGVRMRFANPFGSPGDIRFALPEASDVRVVVVDVAGREVRELFRGHWSSGEHGLHWDGLDARGKRVPSGVYFLRTRTHRGVELSRLVIVR